jgi:sec-independent protein translocase protein TatA
MGELSPWHLLIVAVVLMALFGAKRLPGAAKAVGQSMKIFKDETKGLRAHGDEHNAAATTPAAAQLATATPIAPPAPVSVTVPAAAVPASAVPVAPVPAAPVAAVSVPVAAPASAAPHAVPATPPSA